MRAEHKLLSWKWLAPALLAAVAACGDVEPPARDAADNSTADAMVSAADADPNAPDANPNAPDAAANVADAMVNRADAMPPDASGPYCGDGNIDSPNEQCDDGINNNDNTGPCTKSCRNLVQWTASFNGDLAGGATCKDVAVDSSHNVFAIGHQWMGTAMGGWNIMVRKYSAVNGTLLNKDDYTSADSNGHDDGRGIAVDGANNVIAVGHETNTDGNYDVWVRKYNNNLGTTWTRTYNGAAARFDEATSVDVDSTNAIIVAGSEQTLSSSQTFLRKYKTDGSTEWTYNSPAYLFSGVAVDSTNAFVVSGDDYSSSWFEFVRKYPSGGTPQTWQRDYNNGGYERSHGVAVDSSNNVILVGHDGERDWFIRKYDSSGNVKWTKSYGGSGTSEEAWAAATDSANNIIVVGNSYNGSDFDITLRKYDPDGNVIWTRTHGGPGGYADGANAVVVDGTDHVIVCGYERDTSQTNYFWVRKYSP
jgi:hypothetical protein